MAFGNACPLNYLFRETATVRFAKILGLTREVSGCCLHRLISVCVMCCRTRATPVISLICACQAVLIRTKGVATTPKVIGIHCPDPETHFGNRDDCAKAEMDYCRIGRPL